MSRRQEIADAVIGLLAAEGMRGLTHRAVDRAADLPEGSTSYYFRTRQALLQATVERLADHTAADLAALQERAESSMTGPMIGHHGLVEAAAWLLGQWLTTSRDRQLARYELSLEATRRPELREALLAGGARVRALITRLLVDSGVPDADLWARDLIAYGDGLLLDHLLSDPGELPDLRPKIRALLATVGEG
ncbi:TetR/AcrR family transcriptional regulator [Nonomuraea sp. NPDC050451]|uniref:TetR/AcrR family transcriptional regulator n=1 Tax=Nonomuraea sp. NPDC050451 TaxID=3364364 RepID=UPI0037A040B7